jgi:hypothetical protein
MESRSSPRTLARLGGAIYLLIIAFGVFEVFVRGKLVVPRDAAATAERILATETAWRFSVTAELFSLFGGVVLAAILCVLLRPVSRDAALASGTRWRTSCPGARSGLVGGSPLLWMLLRAWLGSCSTGRGTSRASWAS